MNWSRRKEGRSSRGPLDRSTLSEEDNRKALEDYWRRTLRFTVVLLLIWFLVGYVVSILAAPLLNRVSFLGGPLGFWMAQNGAIYVFWLLILVYALGMNRLDRTFDVEE